MITTKAAFEYSKDPRNWTKTNGVSGGGWDIFAAFNLSMPEGSRFAIFRRRIADTTEYELVDTYATRAAVEQELAAIKHKLWNSVYGFDDLFPGENMRKNPTYGAF